MASLYLILALLIQSSLTYADVKSLQNETQSIEVITEAEELQTDHILDNKLDEEVSKDDVDCASPKTDIEDVLIKGFCTDTNDWVDTFLGSSSNSPTPSTSMMAQAVNSNKSPEEQLEEIKEVASEITMAIQNEMTNLISYALNFGDKDLEGNHLRKRRSIETPMDSSKLVMRLLSHIKSNNEYQNIAIDKMMSAQEIADKYGVEFNPDPEILTDLAFAANEQAKELSSILQDACDPKNVSCNAESTKTEKVQPQKRENLLDNSINMDNATCYLLPNETIIRETLTKSNSTSQHHEHYFQSTNSIPINHVHYPDNHVGYNYYNYDTQIPSPPAQYSYGTPVSTKPTFYDSISYNPNEYYVPYCSVDEMAYPPLEELLDSEPELVREEYEETVSSRVIIEQDDEPGSATVNHIMTYSVSEKAHFRSPQVEKLPQQMQYYFFLM